MAWDAHCNVIGGASLGDGPRRLGRADPARDVGVGDRLTDWDFLQRLPNPLLEGGASDIQRKVESQARRLDETNNPGDQSFVVAVGAYQIGFWKPILQAADELIWIIP